MGKRIIGIDEAGRGPWAGPLLVVAVIGEESALSYARDSKQLNPTKRQQLSIKIKRDAHEIGLGWADSQLIDDLGLSKALNFAAKSAFSSLSKQDLPIVIDGPYDFLGHEYGSVQTLVKADQKNSVVSAASVVAKVVRDRWMAHISEVYGLWDFDKHKGYGTARHRQLIERYGLSPIHRRSFKPIADYEANQHLHRSSSRDSRSS